MSNQYQSVEKEAVIDMQPPATTESRGLITGHVNDINDEGEHDYHPSIRNKLQSFCCSRMGLCLMSVLVTVFLVMTVASIALSIQSLNTTNTILQETNKHADKSKTVNDECIQEILDPFQALMENQLGWLFQYIQEGRAVCQSNVARSALVHLIREGYSWAGMVKSLGGGEDMSLGLMNDFRVATKTLVDASFPCAGCADPFFGACENHTVAVQAQKKLESNSVMTSVFLSQVFSLDTQDTTRLQTINTQLIQCITDAIGIASRSGVKSEFFLQKMALCLDFGDSLGSLLDDFVEQRPTTGPMAQAMDLLDASRVRMR